MNFWQNHDEPNPRKNSNRGRGPRQCCRDQSRSSVRVSPSGPMSVVSRYSLPKLVIDTGAHVSFRTALENRSENAKYIMPAVPAQTIHQRGCSHIVQLGLVTSEVERIPKPIDCMSQSSPESFGTAK